MGSGNVKPRKVSGAGRRIAFAAVERYIGDGFASGVYVHFIIRCVIAVGLILCTSLASSEDLRVGDKAPDFSLPYATREAIVREGLTLSEKIGSGNIILAFYPADWSGGCTKEMCTMRDNFAELEKLGAMVFGISGDYLFSHHEWAKHLDLPFPLLSDHDHEVAKRYASYNAASGYNKRTVYVVDPSGRIAYIDLAYRVDTPDSFAKLKDALQIVK